MPDKSAVRKGKARRLLVIRIKQPSRSFASLSLGPGVEQLMHRKAH